MAIFLDSTDPSEARAAADLGCVVGITTNPLLIAKTGKPAEQVIAEMCAASPGVVFHQITAEGVAGLEAEAKRFLAIAPGCVGLKIPCSRDGMSIARRFAGRAVCAVTAVYSASQAYLASEAGARYVIPYANRAGRQGLQPLELVQQLARVVAVSGRGSEVLAASVKSPEEAVDVLCAGAQHITVPWPVLAAMADHPLTAQALAEFAAAARETR